MDDSEYLKVMLAYAFKDIKTWDELKNQIGGQYGEAVVMDTSKEFTLENAITSLNETPIEKPRTGESQRRRCMGRSHQDYLRRRTKASSVTKLQESD
jgi:hypothetical protein